MIKKKYYYYFGCLQLLHEMFLGSDKIYYIKCSLAAKFMVKSFGLEIKISKFPYTIGSYAEQKSNAFAETFDELVPSLLERIYCEKINGCLQIKLLKAIFNANETVAIYFQKSIYEEYAKYLVYAFMIAKITEADEDDLSTKFVFPNVGEAKLLTIIFSERFAKVSWMKSRFLTFKNFYIFIKSTKLIVASIINYVKNRRLARSCEAKKAMIAMPCLGTGLAVNKHQRTAFPWLFETDLDKSNFLIYFRSANLIPDSEQLEFWANQGVSFVDFSGSITNSEYVDSFGISFRGLKLMFTLLSKLLLKSILLILCFKFSLTKFFLSVIFIVYYAKAYDFIKTNNIKVSLDYETHNSDLISWQQAIEDNNGCGIVYQLSNWSRYNIYPACFGAADVLFTFGPYFRQTLYKNCILAYKNILSSGYLFDNQFSRTDTKSQDLRNSLTANGAKSIICYFDENSADTFNCLIPHERSFRVYKLLIEELLMNDSLGLILSPKKVVDLYVRIPQLEELVNNGLKTGRLILQAGSHGTDRAPIVSAQAADLVIALLIGGTIGLEASLAGKKVIFLDLEQFSRREGALPVVAEHLAVTTEEMLTKVNEQLSSSGITDAIDEISSIDPFCDGHAARRIIVFAIEYIKLAQKKDNPRNNIENLVKQYNEDNKRYT